MIEKHTERDQRFPNFVNIIYFECVLDGSFMYIEYTYFLSPPDLRHILTPIIIMYNLRILQNLENGHLKNTTFLCISGIKNSK